MTLSDYLKVKYPIMLIPADKGGYVAKILDLPGCVTQGETAEEAATMIEDARQAWLTDAFESGDAIPLPKSDSITAVSLSFAYLRRACTVSLPHKPRQRA